MSHAEQYIINSRYYCIIGNVMKRKKSLVAEDNDEHFKMFKSYLEETRTPWNKRNRDVLAQRLQTASTHTCCSQKILPVTTAPRRNA